MFVRRSSRLVTLPAVKQSRLAPHSGKRLPAITVFHGLFGLCSNPDNWKKLTMENTPKTRLFP
jgi:hypothetical protein